VARWSETRGYTLVLSHARGPDRYARVALVRKPTLFGEAHNVCESRAEDASRSGRAPEALGLGRMLSWRWLGLGEAEGLLSARMRTLETLGYAVYGEREGARVGPTRGTWDWLRELVDHQLARGQAGSGSGMGSDSGTGSDSGAGSDFGVGSDSGSDADSDTGTDVDATVEGSPSEDERSPGQRLRAAIEQLGLEAEALLEGLATILSVTQDELSRPTPESAAKLEPEVLAMLLPVWMGHESRLLNEVGARWLAIPATLYELDPDQLARWARGEGALAQVVGARLEVEGLALLGPERLLALAHSARDLGVRERAQAWRGRLS